MSRATTLIAVLLTACLTAMASTSAPAATSAKKADVTRMLEDYTYVVVLAGRQKLELSDSAFYKISRRITFPVNQYSIPRNSVFRKEIEEELMPYMNDSHNVLDSMILRGAASPEGSYERNEFLAEHRAQALFDLIKENSIFPMEEQNLRVEVAEDYNYLLLLMQERGDEDYALVADIVKRRIGTDRALLKQELKKADKGRLWQRLLREYFPQLRAARVVLVFKKFHDFSMEEPVALERDSLKLEHPGIITTAMDMAPLPIPKRHVMQQPLQRREFLSVKTNLLYDLAYMPGYDRFCPIPNVAVEFYPRHGHFTFGASFDCPWWQDYEAHKYFQVRNYQIETRYYFKSGDVDRVGYGNGAAFKGWYLQAYGHMGLYDICFDADRGWRGEGWGGGLGIGYVLPISKNQHWRLEFGAQVGYFRTDYDPYQWLCPEDGEAGGEKYFYKWTGKPEDFKTRQHRFTWIGPTRIGITLTYDLLYRKNGRRGVSFRKMDK